MSTTDGLVTARCKTIYPLPPCTFLGLRPSYVTGIGALTTMYVGSEQCSYFAYFEQSTEHRYIISIKGDPSELHSGSRPHPGRRQSQYSWAHMDPSAHSLAFRGGAEVPEGPIKVWSYFKDG